MWQQEAFGADTGNNLLAPEALRACDSSGLGTGFPGLEGCASQEVGVGAGGGWETLLPQPLAPPLVLAASSPEAFPNGTEVLGGLDSKDDAGDQEEGAPPQAEPEGVLGQRMWGQHAVLGSGALRHGSTPPAPPLTQRGARGRDLRPEGKAQGVGAWSPPPPAASLSTSPESWGRALTQGSATMSHRITRPLSRAPERGWQVAMR